MVEQINYEGGTVEFIYEWKILFLEILGPSRTPGNRSSNWN